MNIVTHDGVFHCDEVVAYTFLNYLYQDNTLIRTRDESIINDNQNKFVIDVGKVYDHDKKRYDHHQESCNEYFDSNKQVPLSSAGLVYRHYGLEFISKFVLDLGFTATQEQLKKLYTSFYYDFVQAIDANDNGIMQYTTTDKPVFNTQPTVPYIINKFNNANIYNANMQLEAFKEASRLISSIIKPLITTKIRNIIDYDTDMVNIKGAIDKRLEYSKDGSILVVETDSNNYFGIILELEKQDPTIYIKYIIYKSNTEWRVRTLGTNFVSRKVLLSYDTLKPVIGDDLIFVHKNLFIAACKTFDAALQVAICSNNS